LLGYNTDLFEEATAGRLAGHYRVVLEAIAADPAQRLSNVSLLAGEEGANLVRLGQSVVEQTNGDALLTQLEAFSDDELDRLLEQTLANIESTPSGVSKVHDHE
jgi:hypothetical protein